MEALCITLVPIPRSLARSNKSACVVALQKPTHIMLLLIIDHRTNKTAITVFNQHQSTEGWLCKKKQ